MSKNNNIKSTLSEEPTANESAKDEAKIPSQKDALDMVSSALIYLAKSGAPVNIRQSPKHGAVITLPTIQALNGGQFEPLPNQLPNHPDGLPNQ